MKPPSRLVFLLVAAWFLLRGLLLWHGWHGDPSPERLAEALSRFPAEEVDAGRDYMRARFPIGAIHGFATPLLLLLLLLAGTLHRLHGRIERAAGGGPWRTTLLFALALSLLLDALSLPFAAWSHAVERAAGFATIGWGGWALLRAKSALASAALFSGGVLLVYAVIRRFPRRWPVLLPFAGTLASALLALLSPHLLTPLFHTQTPLPPGELRTRIEAVAARAGIPVEDLFVLDASRYSRHTNAYFTGLFGKRRIVLYDTLVNDLPPDACAAIFAHEAGHWLHDHMAKGVALSFLGALAACLLLSALRPWAAADARLRVGAADDPRNLPLLLVLFPCVSLLAAPVPAQISQFMERQADRAALDLTADPDACEAAHLRLAAGNRGFLTPSLLQVFWLFSHPPALDRLAAVDAWRRERGLPVPARGKKSPPASASPEGGRVDSIQGCRAGAGLLRSHNRPG